MTEQPFRLASRTGCDWILVPDSAPLLPAALLAAVVVFGIRFGLFLRRLITVVPAIVAGVDAYQILIVTQVALSIQLPFAILPIGG